jgi:hypothetical protein
MEVEFRVARAGLSFVRTWLVRVEFSEHFLRLIRLLDIRIAGLQDRVVGFFSQETSS